MIAKPKPDHHDESQNPTPEEVVMEARKYGSITLEAISGEHGYRVAEDIAMAALMAMRVLITASQRPESFADLHHEFLRLLMAQKSFLLATCSLSIAGFSSVCRSSIEYDDSEVLGRMIAAVGLNMKKSQDGSHESEGSL